MFFYNFVDFAYFQYYYVHLVDTLHILDLFFILDICILYLSMNILCFFFFVIFLANSF